MVSLNIFPIVILIIIFIIALLVVVIMGISLERKVKNQNTLRDQENRLKQAQLKNDFYSKISGIVSKHLNTLVSKRIQKIWIDDYGRAFSEEWEKEVFYFLHEIVEPELTEEDEKIFFNNNITEIAAEYVEAVVFEVQQRREEMAEFDETMSGIDFEHLCADMLKANDWEAKVTTASGDQGIDVIAEKDGICVVLQCKRSATPIGNKAVQEAIAGKTYAKAHIACVVSNAEYTPSAKQLANASNVFLLHYSQLPELDKIIFQE